jgi:hypothetical protein
MHTFYQSFERILNAHNKNMYLSDHDWEEFLVKIFPLGFFEIGYSQKGQKIYGIKIGSGALKVSIIAGCHADEPAGPFMLKYFLLWLKQTSSGNELLKKWTFFIIPQMNPDGALNNKEWMSLPISLKMYLKESSRELPGDDIEFGFPESSNDINIRPENKAAADFLGSQGPIHAHFSLHSLGLGGGVWFLIGENNCKDSFQLQAKLKGVSEKFGLPLYDIDRKGEKGFYRLSPGFSTTPNSVAVKKYLIDHDQVELANKIKLSSMEFIEKLGGEPLMVVSEIPNFVSPFLQTIKNEEDQQLKQFILYELQKSKLELKKGNENVFNDVVEQFSITPISIKDQVRIQFRMILCTLSEVRSKGINRFLFFQ